MVSAVNLLPPSSQIKAVEDDWEQNSVVGEALLPRVQSLLLALGQGNEKAYPGRDGWLFYRADFDYVTGRGFLDPTVLKRRATTGGDLKAPQPDPIKAIVHFRDQLAARGIALIVMPAPVKPSIYPECHSRRYAGRSPVVQNPSFADFKRATGASRRRGLRPRRAARRGQGPHARAAALPQDRYALDAACHGIDRRRAGRVRPADGHPAGTAAGALHDGGEDRRERWATWR